MLPTPPLKQWPNPRAVSTLAAARGHVQTFIMTDSHSDPDRYRPPQLARTTIWEKVQIFGFLAAIAASLVIILGKFTPFTMGIPPAWRLVVAALGAAAGFRFAQLWYRVNGEYMIDAVNQAAGFAFLTFGSGFLFYLTCR